MAYSAVNDSGLEVDWMRQQSDNERTRKQQPLDDGLHHVSEPYSDTAARKLTESKSRRVLGLSVVIFWLVATALVLILAAAIGGGVAGGLAAQKKSCTPPQSSASPSPTLATSSTSSTTISSTTSSAATSGPSPQISTPCTGNNAANGSTLIASDASGTNSIIGSTPHNFLLVCNTNYPAGAAYGNPNLVDLLMVYTPDMAGCISACAEYNVGYAVSSGGPRCAAVAVVKIPGEFCYLKSATGVNNTSSSGGKPIDSAILLT